MHTKSDFFDIIIPRKKERVPNPEIIPSEPVSSSLIITLNKKEVDSAYL